MYNNSRSGSAPCNLNIKLETCDKIAVRTLDKKKIDNPKPIKSNFFHNLRRQSIEHSGYFYHGKLQIERDKFSDEVVRATNLDIEKELDIESLIHIKNIFLTSGPDSDKDRVLSLTEFKQMFKSIMNYKIRDEKLEFLFRKIDSLNRDVVSWNDFCSHMQIYFKDHSFAYQKFRVTSFDLPAKVQDSPHKESVISIFHASKDGTITTVGSDGIICFWTPIQQLKRWKATNIKSDSIVKGKSGKSHSITDATIIMEWNKILMSSVDREILIFELSSLEPYCSITSLESIPLCMTHGWTKERPEECLIILGDSDGCIAILKVFNMTEALLSWKKSPTFKNVPSASLETVILNPLVQFIRWKVHSDWVVQVHYEVTMNQIFSCSNAESNSLVIGAVIPSTSFQIKSKQDQINVTESIKSPTNDAKIIPRSLTTIDEITSNASNLKKKFFKNLDQSSSRTSNLTPHGLKIFNPNNHGIGCNNLKANQVYNIIQLRFRKPNEQTIFRVYKGINTFDFSITQNIIATGGLDRCIRLWNPYMNSKPIGILRGMNSPIHHLNISSVDARLFVIGTDKMIKVWDVMDQKVLQQVRPKAHKIRGDLGKCFYSSICKSLIVSTDQINFVPVKTNPFVSEKQWWDRHFTSDYYGGSFVDPVLQSQQAHQKVKHLKHKGPLLNIQTVPSHTKDIVTCLAFNPLFGHLLSGSYSSVIKVWDITSGSKILEFDGVHENSPVSRMTFDVAFRRLFTSGHDGSIRMWNYTNGNCICKFVRSDEKLQHLEMNDLIYIDTTNNQFIVSVGWDQRINVFLDPYPQSPIVSSKPTTLQDTGSNNITSLLAGSGPGSACIFPLNSWPDDLVAGHRNDILSIAAGPPTFIATGDHGGHVIVWNMISGHIFCRLDALRTIAKSYSFDSDTRVSEFDFKKDISSNEDFDKEPSGNSKRKLSSCKEDIGVSVASSLSNHPENAIDGDLGIHRLAFINSRIANRNAACLISCGPMGVLHFWRIYGSGQLIAAFPGGSEISLPITAIAMGGPINDTLDKASHTKHGIMLKETVMFVADRLGFIMMYEISDFALEFKSELVNNPPKIIRSWRAHTKQITDLTIVQKDQLLISSSFDSTVRMWTWCGHYIGTFGQPELWDIYQPKSFQHPIGPLEVLFDSKSWPKYLLTPSNSFIEQSTSKIKSVDNEIALNEKIDISNIQMKEVNLEELNRLKEGKWLRFQRNRPIKVFKNGPSEFHQIPYYELEDPPQLEEPITIKMRSDFDEKMITEYAALVR